MFLLNAKHIRPPQIHKDLVDSNKFDVYLHQVSEENRGEIKLFIWTKQETIMTRLEVDARHEMHEGCHCHFSAHGCEES